MPEGDTIARTAAALNAWLAGQVATAARPARFERLAGRRFVSAEAMGKHLFLNFEGGAALHTHMRMSGSWHLYRPGERWRGPAHATSVVLEFPDAVAVCFRAPVAELVAGRMAVAHLGPDVLDPSFDPMVAAARARQVDPVTVGEVLLDQRVAAGIGNFFRCEALWQQRVSPFRPVAGCTDEELAWLFASAAAMMRVSAEGGRRVPAVVYGRARRPCRACGKPIAVRRLGEHARLVYWCPSCQVR